MTKCGLVGIGSLAVGVLLATAGQALGQATQRAAFVANNGNVEGSVTAYTFNPSGAPVFVAKYITGAGSGSPGNNAYAISLTPNGKHLITTHATANSVTEQITMFQVNADATLQHLGNFATPDSPLAAAWVSDDLLAVTLTKSGGANFVILYRWNPAALTLVEVNRQASGSFTGYLAVHPSGDYLYSEDAPLFGSSHFLRAFAVDHGAGTLTFLGDAHTSPSYALGPSVTPDGRRLYAGGGISSGGNVILGFDVDKGTGLLNWMQGSPFISPGSSPSPKQAIATPDSKFLFVGHGSSSVVRSFEIDPFTGVLTDTGFFYKVGNQGDLGGIAVLGDLVLFTRKFSSTTYGPTGLLSYTVHPNGSFTANGTVVSSQGVSPQFLVAWDPPQGCYANCDESTVAPVLNVADFTCFLQRFSAGESYANCDGSTTPPVLNVSDFTCFLQKFAAGCP